MSFSLNHMTYNLLQPNTFVALMATATKTIAHPKQMKPANMELFLKIREVLHDRNMKTNMHNCCNVDLHTGTNLLFDNH